MGKTQLELFHHTIDGFIAAIERFNSTTPSIYFLPIRNPGQEIGPEDPYLPEFYIAANFVTQRDRLKSLTLRISLRLKICYYLSRNPWTDTNS